MQKFYMCINEWSIILLQVLDTILSISYRKFRSELACQYIQGIAIY